MMNRRNFLKKTAAGLLMPTTGLILPPALSLITPSIALAETGTKDDFWKRNRTLSVYRTDSKEKVSVTFFKDGKYDLDAYARLCWVFRDVKDQNRWIKMDVDLLNSAWALQEWQRYKSNTDPWLNVNSAFRTSRRNARIEGAARDSQHTKGRALDVTMTGVSIKELANRARYLNVGGVGVYGTFLHMDSWHEREWKGR
jgi:yegA